MGSTIPEKQAVTPVPEPLQHTEYSFIDTGYSPVHTIMNTIESDYPDETNSFQTPSTANNAPVANLSAPRGDKSTR